MSAQEYAAAVIAERGAFLRLTYLLRVHGAKSSRLREVDKAFATWRELAGLLDQEGGDHGTE